MFSLGKIVDFLLEHHPHAKEWPPENLASWASAFLRQELIICSSDDGRHITGMVMFRLVMDPEDGVRDHYSFDPEGACVFLDFTAGTPAVRSELIVSVIRRVGARPLVAWERRGSLRVYDSERFVRHNLKKEKA